MHFMQLWIDINNFTIVSTIILVIRIMHVELSCEEDSHCDVLQLPLFPGGGFQGRTGRSIAALQWNPL